MSTPTINYQSVVNTVSASLNITAPTPGTYTVTDPSTGAQATLQVVQAPVFRPAPMNGLGAGGPFFANPLG